MSALIVEGDVGVRHRVRAHLQDRGLRVSVAGTVADAATAIAAHSFRVAIVDLALPDGSGLEVLDLLRQAGATAHVIVLSGSTAEIDRVEALQRGANDFVVKPFFLKELTARVLAVRRRGDPERDTSVQVGHCEMDLRARQVTCAGKPINLTTMEFDLLAYLAVRPGHVFSREQLLNAVWRSASEWQQSATVTEHVRRLRNKIELDPSRPIILVTVRGAGYRLDLPASSQGRAAVEHLPPEVGVIVHVNGCIVFTDDAARALAAVPATTTLVGTRLLDLAAPSSRAVATARLAEVEGGRPRRSEIMQLRRADGQHVMVAVTSAKTDWHGQQARRVELTAVTDAPARLRRMVTGVLADVTDAVIVTDLYFHIRSWNSAAERTYGWTEEMVLGRHVLDVLQWAGDEGHLAAAWDQLERTGRWNGTGLQVTRDGSTVDILGSTTLLRDDDGEPIGVVSVNRLAEVAGRARNLELDKALAARVKEGIANDEFVVHYQPIVDLASGHLLTLEALVRWEHPERGTLNPAEFLDAAERSGSIVELGKLVLDTACRQAAAWRRDGADILLSVNVSTRQLADETLTKTFTDILSTSGFDPAYLWIEVTETAIVEELEKAAHALHALVALGVGVSIDDFGTGWASLTYLKNFPVHALKIDRSFVAGIERDANATAIVRSILSLGAELGMFVVAEGIETKEQLDLLAAMGCKLGQGYLLGRPTPAAQVPVERAARVRPAADAAAIPSGRADGVASTGIGMAPRVRGVTQQRASAEQAGGTVPRPKRAEPGGQIAPMPSPANRIESDAVATLLRGLLRVSSAPGAVDLLQRTIRLMGGTIVPVAVAGDDALPIDVSLGEGPSMLVEVEPLSVARMQLERLLPRLVEDARQAVDLLRRTERLQDETIRDRLTGLGNRRALDRVLPRARSGSIVMLDLDHFKAVNDQHGHAAGDEILRSFGTVLGEQVRVQDTPCRIGGEEFALVLADLDVPAAVALVERIRTTWGATSHRTVTFSAGVAAVIRDGGTEALLAADRALYRAKDQGRDRTVTAPATSPAQARR